MGTSIEELDTPALVLDGPAAQRNLQQLAAYFRDRSCKLRPHFKNHKCATLARLQLQAGSAVGITCAKLAEAQVLAEQGFEDVLIANQVIGRQKVHRLAQIARKMRITVAVDDATNVQTIGQAARDAGSTVGILVEVDIGMGRCGVPAGEPTLELARLVMDTPGVELRGLQAYEGHLVGVEDRDERARQTVAAMQHAVATRELLAQHGMTDIILSGGSTATYKTTSTIAGFAEMQCGTYATMDWRYQQLAPEFEVALSVLATVISCPRPGVVVLDLGVKGIGAEFGVPKVKDYPATDIPLFGAEEHTVVQHTPDWRVGQKVQLLSSHACTTCNLYRNLHVHDQGQVLEIWPIEAAGLLT